METSNIVIRQLYIHLPDSSRIAKADKNGYALPDRCYCQYVDMQMPKDREAPGKSADFPARPKSTKTSAGLQGKLQ